MDSASVPKTRLARGFCAEEELCKQGSRRPQGLGQLHLTWSFCRGKPLLAANSDSVRQRT